MKKSGATIREEDLGGGEVGVVCALWYRGLGWEKLSMELDGRRLLIGEGVGIIGASYCASSSCHFRVIGLVGGEAQYPVRSGEAGESSDLGAVEK